MKVTGFIVPIAACLISACIGYGIHEKLQEVKFNEGVEVSTQSFDSTTNLGLRKPHIGTQGWGEDLNANADTIDSNLGGQVGRTATFVVAASDATALAIAQSDYQCDGTADDVQIQAAADAADAVGGGTVQLTEGNFVTSSSIQIHEAVFFVGAGPRATNIKLATNADTDMFRHDEESSDVFAGIRDMTLEGNKANNVSGSAVIANGSAASQIKDLTLMNLFVLNFSDTAIQTDFCWGWYIENSVFEFNENSAIEFTGGTHAQILDNKFSDNNGHSIVITGASRVLIGGNFIRQNLSFSDWYSGLVEPAGILLDANSNRIVGNEFDVIGVGTQGIRFTANGDQNVVAGNNFNGSSIGSYGINTLSGALYNSIIGNQIDDDFDTADIKNTGSWSNSIWGNGKTDNTQSTNIAGVWDHYYGSGGQRAFDVFGSAATNAYYRMWVPLAFQERAIITVAAATGIAAADIVSSVVLVAGDGGAIDITADPQIANGHIAGQIIIIQGTSDSNTVKFDDGTGLHMSGSVTLGDKDTLIFMYLESDWVQISTSNN